MTNSSVSNNSESDFEEGNLSNEDYGLNIEEDNESVTLLENDNNNNNSDIILIEIDDNKFEAITTLVNKANTLKAAHNYIKIFANIINEIETNKKIKYQISDEYILKQFIYYYFEKIPLILNKVTEIKTEYIKVIIKKYIKNLITYLESLDNDESLIIILTKLKMYNFFILNLFLLKKIIIVLIRIWSKNENIKIKIKCFLLLKSLIDIIKEKEAYKNVIEFIFKSMYLEFYNVSNHLTYRNYNQIIININTFSELLKTETSIGYIVLFKVLKNLTTTLNKMFAIKNKDNITNLYNVSNYNMLRLVSRCLLNNTNSELEQLIFPLIEIINGFITIYESNNYIPLKLKLIEILLELSANSNVNISVFNYLKTIILNKSIINFTVKKEKKINIDLNINIKYNDEVIRSNQYWNEIIKKTFYLFFYQLSSYNYSIFFSEYSIMLIKLFKKILKTCKNKIIYIELKKLLLLLNSKFDDCIQERNKIKKSVKDVINNKNYSGKFKFTNKAILLEFLKQKGDLEREINQNININSNKNNTIIV